MISLVDIKKKKKTCAGVMRAQDDNKVEIELLCKYNGNVGSDQLG